MNIVENPTVVIVSFDFIIAVIYMFLVCLEKVEFHVLMEAFGGIHLF